MREILFKHLNAKESRKKDIFMQEVLQKDGVMTKTERRCFYFIKAAVSLGGEENLKKWLDGQNNGAPQTKRHFYILKEHNDALGEDKFVCKIAGVFYAVVDFTVYTIAFLHSFKVRFMKVPLTQ
jgi:hypothetical protein